MARCTVGVRELVLSAARLPIFLVRLSLKLKQPTLRTQSVILLTLALGFLLAIPVAEFAQDAEVRNERGETIPDIRKCARSNFPPRAKPYVTKAKVELAIVVDRDGIVREAEPLEVKLIEAENSTKARSTMPSFARAARDSLLNQKCPVYYRNGQPSPYKLTVPLIYEIKD